MSIRGQGSPQVVLRQRPGQQKTPLHPTPQNTGRRGPRQRTQLEILNTGAESWGPPGDLGTPPSYGLGSRCLFPWNRLLLLTARLSEARSKVGPMKGLEGLCRDV